MSTQDGFFSFRTFAISGAIVIGSGMGLILYQQYLSAQSQRQLVREVQKLNKHIIKLESELKKVQLVPSSSSEDIEDIFLDASEAEPPAGKR